MGTFLDDLKKSVETGEFNSEAAKKIIEVNKLADEKEKQNPFKLVIDRIEKSGFAESATEEEAIVLNSEYEKKMEEIKKQDAVNKQLATLIEIEDMVKATINDMMSFVDELEHKFEKEFDAEDPMFGELNQKIEQIKTKYSEITLFNN
jgi:hypothetical protein